MAHSMQRAQFILAHVTQMRMRNFFFIVTTANILRSYRTKLPSSNLQNVHDERYMESRFGFETELIPPVNLELCYVTDWNS